MPKKTLTEHITIDLTLKQWIYVVGLLAALIGGWFDLKSDIKNAAESPEAEVTRLEYEMKFINMAGRLIELDRRITKIEEKVHD